MHLLNKLKIIIVSLTYYDQKKKKGSQLCMLALLFLMQYINNEENSLDRFIDPLSHDYIIPKIIFNRKSEHS